VGVGSVLRSAAGVQDLKLPTPFRHFSPRRQPWFRFQPGNDYGLIEVQMAVSRDGIHWDRPDRRPYFPMGLPDEWDRWLTMMGVGMVRKAEVDQIRFAGLIDHDIVRLQVSDPKTLFQFLSPDGRQCRHAKKPS
jgi:hypothetical protein